MSRALKPNDEEWAYLGLLDVQLDCHFDGFSARRGQRITGVGKNDKRHWDLAGANVGTSNHAGVARVLALKEVTLELGRTNLESLKLRG